MWRVMIAAVSNCAQPHHQPLRAAPATTGGDWLAGSIDQLLSNWIINNQQQT